MSEQYSARCDCGEVALEMTSDPRVHAFCNCEDCRTLLDMPYHPVVAWDADQVRIVSGEEHTVEYRHPTLEMHRVFCKHCGETLYNTNAMGWKIVTQLLISKCNEDELPAEFESNAHFYYDRRIFDITDQLQKS